MSERRWQRIEGGKRRRAPGMGLLLCLVTLLSAVAGGGGVAWSNSELHPGGRLFFPLWDVSTTNRLTFIVVTREALGQRQSIVPTLIGTAGTTLKRFQVQGAGNCRPRGAEGSEEDINRTDLGGTGDTPIFVDDVHFQYYGKSCGSANEIVHMSCADIDVFLLASESNPHVKPRAAFAAVASDGRGALEVHLVTNATGDPSQRKEENSLMGHAVISDLSEGWAAVYSAAAAKATSCETCGLLGGTPVGYENYPMEVYLPMAFADSFPAPGGGVRNLLSLWGPGLFPGRLDGTSVSVDIRWWDGRERAFGGSVANHAIVRPLGGEPMAGVDPPLDSTRFSVAGFVCGHDPSGARAENDGFPRSGSDAAACGAPDVPDPTHQSDNLEVSVDITERGHTIQPSTAIGWWRFQLRPDNRSPLPGGAHSGRGLVGVLLSSTPGANFVGVGDATRLWHEDACAISQSGRSFGPPHARDGGVWANQSSPIAPSDLISLFNTLARDDQERVCRGAFIGT
jgi:hypothetical protein